MPPQPFQLSVVVPVHNEAPFLPVGLPRLVDAVHTEFPEAEILIVENGSTDATAAIAKRVGGDSVTVLELPDPDYGAAMREGMLAATGDWVVTFDIDYFSAAFLADLTRLAGSADLVIASKRDPRSEDRRPLFRRTATLVFNLLLRTVLESRVSDTHGIKAFRTEMAREHAESVLSRKDLFDTELVIRMERADARIVEVPVVVEELRPAKSALFRRVPRTVRGLFAIRRSLSSPSR